MFGDIPDNLDLYYKHEAEQCRKEAKLPKCDYCGETIQDDYLYDICGDLICEDCLNREYRKSTDNYIDD